MTRPIRTLALGAVLAALSAPSLAFVSIESDEIGAPAQGTSGQLTGALDGRSGNGSFQDLSMGGRLNYQAGVTSMFLAGEYDNAKVDHHNVEETSWLHAGYIDEFQHGLAAEAFADYLKDDFRLLDSRTQVGAGARFTLDYEPKQRGVYAGLGLLHEWEDQAGGDSDYWRLNSYLAYKRELNEHTGLLFDLYYQPRLNHANDYLVSSELGLLVKLATSLDLKLGVRYEYDNKAPAGVDSSTTRYTTSLNYRF